MPSLSPLDDIIVAYFSTQQLCICCYELVSACIWINDCVVLQFILKQYIYLGKTVTFSISAISSEVSSHACLPDD